jgi:hypothetical protein
VKTSNFAILFFLVHVPSTWGSNEMLPFC